MACAPLAHRVLHVLLARSGEKVIDVDAAPVVARMAYVDVSKLRAIGLLVQPSVSQPHAAPDAWTDVESSVALGSAARPLDAVRSVECALLDESVARAGWLSA